MCPDSRYGQDEDCFEAMKGMDIATLAADFRNDIDCMSDANDCTYVRNSKRKSQELVNILMKHYQHYNGKWEPEMFNDLIKKTGYTKKQINKWMWDRKKKERDALQAKKLSYPGLIFQIKNSRTGKDLTPSFTKLASKMPLFTITKVKR